MPGDQEIKMRRKNDAHMDEFEGVAERLRKERPELDPLVLDRIKMTVMSRAKAATGHGRVGARRLAVAGLTVGLMAAGTGGVIAATGGGGGTNGNAATAQYGNCDVGNNTNNNVGNGEGSENNNNNNNFNCNNNSFNTTNNGGAQTTINNYFSTVTVSAAAEKGIPSIGVLGSKTSARHIHIHIHIPRKAHLRRVTLKVNGKVVSVLKGHKASANINLVNLPCGKGATTVTIIAVTDNGKTLKESRQFHLCQA